MSELFVGFVCGCLGQLTVKGTGMRDFIAGLLLGFAYFGAYMAIELTLGA